MQFQNPNNNYRNLYSLNIWQTIILFLLFIKYRLNRLRSLNRILFFISVQFIIDKALGAWHLKRFYFMFLRRSIRIDQRSFNFFCLIRSFTLVSYYFILLWLYSIVVVLNTIAILVFIILS